MYRRHVVRIAYLRPSLGVLYWHYMSLSHQGGRRELILNIDRDRALDPLDREVQLGLIASSVPRLATYNSCVGRLELL